MTKTNYFDKKVYFNTVYYEECSGKELTELYQLLESFGGNAAEHLILTLLGDYEALEFSSIVPGSDVYSLSEFKQFCEEGHFIDYDGFGVFANGAEKSNAGTVPSRILEGDHIPSWATHIVWYNR